MKKIKTVAAAIIAAAIAALGAASIIIGVVTKKNEQSEFPAGGIYFARTDSSICLTGRTQNPLVTLTVFDVKKDNYKSFLSYEDISLIGENGKEYSKKDVSIVYTYTDSYFSKLSVSLVLDINEFDDDCPAYISQAKLSSKSGDKYCDLGSICILVCKKSKNSDIAFGGYTQSSEQFSSYTVLVSNNGEKSVYLKRLIMNFRYTESSFTVYDTAGKPAQLDGYEIEAGKSAYIRVTLEPDETLEKYPFCFVRPALEYADENGETSYTGVNSTVYYNAITDREDVKSYLKILGGSV